MNSFHSHIPKTANMLVGNASATLTFTWMGHGNRDRFSTQKCHPRILQIYSWSEIEYRPKNCCSLCPTSHLFQPQKCAQERTSRTETFMEFLLVQLTPWLQLFSSCSYFSPWARSPLPKAGPCPMHASFTVRMKPMFPVHFVRFRKNKTVLAFLRVVCPYNPY